MNESCTKKGTAYFSRMSASWYLRTYISYHVAYSTLRCLSVDGATVQCRISQVQLQSISGACEIVEKLRMETSHYTRLYIVKCFMNQSDTDPWLIEKLYLLTRIRS